MYNNYNPYLNNYNNLGQQSLSEKIDGQIAQLNQMKEQLKNNSQQPAINQTFQLAPTNNHGIRYANTIDDVSKEIIYFDTPFFSKDMSVLWIKDTKNNIKTYELTEIIPKDEKDLTIELLQSQIEDLKGMIKNEPVSTNVTSKQDATDTSTNDNSNGNASKKNKSTGFQKVSRSKE